MKSRLIPLLPHETARSEWNHPIVDSRLSTLVASKNFVIVARSHETLRALFNISHSNMKAIAVRPGTSNSVHVAELDKPSVSDIPDDRGVLVRVLKVGVDATDREINDALYGNAPEGYDFLVIGHECFGIVEEVGSAVKKVQPGDYVTCTVRRPGGSIFDAIGRSDITSEEEYYERGINLRHGYLTGILC